MKKEVVEFGDTNLNDKSSLWNDNKRYYRKIYVYHLLWKRE